MLLNCLKITQRISLEKGERVDTSLVEFAINTGDLAPKKQVVRRIPYAARQEITRQLMKMQLEGVIQPSESPWDSFSQKERWWFTFLR